MIKTKEKGFVLATSLVILLLMTILTAAVFISVDSSQKSSMAAESSTQAFYYAETAANYMSWALLNNVEFDSYTYPANVKPGAKFFDEPSERTGIANREVVLGDYDEWKANRGNPSRVDRVAVYSSVADTYVQNAPLNGDPTKDAYGQLAYYDNTALTGRMVWLRSTDIYSENAEGLPTMYKIHKKLPRYIMLSIDADGKITPSIPIYNSSSPHHADVQGTDYPKNGALVWLTGGNRTDDWQVDPIDNFFAPVYTVTGMTKNYDPGQVSAPIGTAGDKIYGTGYDPYGMTAAANRNIACQIGSADEYSTACSHDGTWLKGDDYGLVIYALGYVRGKAQKLIRVVYKE